MPHILDRFAAVSIAAAAILLLSMCAVTAAYSLPFLYWTIMGEAVAIVGGIAALYGLACFAWAYLGAGR